MKLENNPFEYEAANNLKDELIAEYYIDDFNYSRFIQSRRNVFLIGERGSGKTMALLFSRWRLQKLLAERERAKTIFNYDRRIHTLQHPFDAQDRISIAG